MCVYIKSSKVSTCHPCGYVQLETLARGAITTNFFFYLGLPTKKFEIFFFVYKWHVYVLGKVLEQPITFHAKKQTAQFENH